MSMSRKLGFVLTVEEMRRLLNEGNAPGSVDPNLMGLYFALTRSGIKIFRVTSNYRSYSKADVSRVPELQALTLAYWFVDGAAPERFDASQDSTPPHEYLDIYRRPNATKAANFVYFDAPSLRLSLIAAEHYIISDAYAETGKLLSPDMPPPENDKVLTLKMEVLRGALSAEGLDKKAAAYLVGQFCADRWYDNVGRRKGDIGLLPSLPEDLNS